MIPEQAGRAGKLYSELGQHARRTGGRRVGVGKRGTGGGLVAGKWRGQACLRTFDPLRGIRPNEEEHYLNLPCRARQRCRCSSALATALLIEAPAAEGRRDISIEQAARGFGFLG